MKRLLFSAAILALVSVPAFAAKNSQSVTIPQAVSIGTNQLPAGDYKVTWTGTGSNVQVTLVQKDKYTPQTTTVNAKVVEGTDSHTGFTVDRQGNVNVLQTLQLGKTTIVFAGAPANGQ
jgi:curli biogenesis system outer membrane secretion channel CsgG